jgi:hypothetical protein
VPPVALTVASAPARLSPRSLTGAASPCTASCPSAEPAPVTLAAPAPALDVAPAAETAPETEPLVSSRPRLRLVTSTAPDEPAAAVHGRGGPASCRCRACVMARHPSAMPRLTVVR